MRRGLIVAAAAWWACACLLPAAPISHTIEKGETLYSLSRRYAVSVREIQEANPTVDASKLKVGQRIQIPVKEPTPPTPTPGAQDSAKPAPATPDPSPAGPAPDHPPASVTPGPSVKSDPPTIPEFHTVAKGDTLSSISRAHGLTLTELRQLNPGTSDVIAPGQLIRIRKTPAPLIDSGPPPEPPAPAPPAPPGPPKKTEPPPAPKKDTPAPPPQYVFIHGKTRTLIDRPKLSSRNWRYIVIHHSGTRSGNAKIFDYYHRRVRGMENGLAYHFVIGNGTESGDGEIEIGERWLKQLQGGHVRSDAQNEVAIGICLVGDFQRSRPTRRQISSLIELIGYLQDRVGDPEPRLFLHRDINVISTDCPGRNFPAAALYRLFGGQPKRPKE